MRHLMLLLVLFVVLGAEPAANAQAIEDFRNVSRAIGKEVSVVDRTGLVREGIVEAATADDVTMRVGSIAQSFKRAEIASAERIKDESSDGAIKGAIWALAVALMPNQGWTSSGDYLRGVALAFVILPTAGYLLDAAETHRQPLYRASAATPTLKVSWRF